MDRSPPQDPPRGDLPELALEPGTLFIGDLHLDAASAADCAGFADWIAELPPDCPRLVILGDLFDAWVGPAHARLEGAAAVVEALRAATGRGTAIDVVPGNRDFLLGSGFERASGARVRAHGLVAVARGPAAGPTTGGAAGAAADRVLCLHGDELCTLDRAYQRMKRVLRSGPVTWLAPRLPDRAALWAARRLRGASRQAVAAKPSAEKAQQEDAVRHLAAAHRCGTLVCGHAHRFRDDRLAGGARWIVLDAFGGALDVLSAGPRGLLEARPSRARRPLETP